MEAEQSCWRGSEEILHIQGQRSPSKMVGTGAEAVQCWSDCEHRRYPTFKSKGEAPARWQER